MSGLLVVASSRFEKTGDWSGESYEIGELRRAAQGSFDDVLPVSFNDVALIAETSKPIRVFALSTEITHASALIVRGTTNHFEAAMALSAALEDGGTRLLDPMERFRLGTSSKVMTTLSRHRRGVGSSSMLIFGSGAARLAQSDRSFGLEPPLLAKPISGSQGEGIKLVSDLSELVITTEPLLLQTLEQFVREYRALLLDRIPIGIIRKQRPPEQIQANAARGGTFHAIDNDDWSEVVSFLNGVDIPRGLVGVDVAVTEHGTLRIIEENYSPQWETLDKALSQKTADAVIAHLCGPVGSRVTIR